jgi:hypothetical protein
VSRNSWLSRSILGAIGAGIFVCQCASAYETAEIKPGEKDYPVERSAPRHVVQLAVTVPPGYSLVASAGYVATSPGGTLASGTSCQREIGFAVTAPFDLDTPVKMVRDGGVSRGALVVDRFEPGRCDWQLRALVFQLLRPGSKENALRYAAFPFRNRKRLPGDRHGDYWCSARGGCSHLALLLTDREVGSAFVASIPEAKRGNGDGVSIGVSTTSLSIEFHDLDSIDPRTRMAGGPDPEAIKKTREYKALLCFQQANIEYQRAHQPLPDTAAQNDAIDAMTQKCRAEVGLPPE